MERKLIPWVVAFGLIMIMIGHYKRMSKEEAKQAAGYDPLVESIEKYNTKKDSKFGIDALVKKKKKIAKTLDTVMGNSGGDGDDGAAVPEDGFLVKKDDPNASATLKYKVITRDTAGGGDTGEGKSKKQKDEGQMESLLSKIKDPVPTGGGYYPPLAADNKAAATPAPEQPKTYYPPTVPAVKTPPR